MTKVAIWCRHVNDNIIGIGPHIPWHIKSDFQRFRRITTGQTLVVGQKTYESFPGRTLPERKIFVLSQEEEYEVADRENHLVINDVKFFKDFEQDLYIAGGATVYWLFMNGGGKLMPEIVVDCVYNGELKAELEGEPVTITPCIEILNKNYRQISTDYELDNVTTRVWLRRGEFVDQNVLKKIITAIEEETN